jgi:hypothetical protein
MGGSQSSLRPAQGVPPNRKLLHQLLPQQWRSERVLSTTMRADAPGIAIRYVAEDVRLKARVDAGYSGGLKG